jgi:hypothetical protein
MKSEWKERRVFIYVKRMAFTTIVVDGDVNTTPNLIIRVIDYMIL